MRTQDIVIGETYRHKEHPNYCESFWKSVAIGVICFVIGFIVAVHCSDCVEKTHIKNGHTPYLDANSGLMWQSHNIVE